jgi:hypothetical protein
MSMHSNNDHQTLAELRKNAIAAVVVLLPIGFVTTEPRFLGASILIW